MTEKTALITGVTGQDGAYLAELLLKKGYTVHGIKRRSSSFNTGRIDHLYQDPHVDHRNFVLHYGDLTDSTNLIRIVQETQPDELYNLAAQSHVKVSFETPEYTANSDALGTLRLLEALGLITPYVTFVLQPASKFDENLIKTALSLNPEVSTDTLLLWLSIAIVTIFIFKAISVIFINNMIIGFSQDQQIKIRSQLMKNIQIYHIVNL